MRPSRPRPPAPRDPAPLGKPLTRLTAALFLLAPVVPYSQSVDDSPGSARVSACCVHLDNGPLAADPGARVVPCDGAEATYAVCERHGKPDAHCTPAKNSSPLAYSETGLAGFPLRLRTHDTGADPAPAPTPGIPR
ncbi:hypothetical protein [Streptomyces sp. AM 3-1-1]|uniref:hypothetical protein n=1 Tax=Streptomyces sp. AM 3-1-1 TaxID=3028711 RepID=UPI0023B9E2EC|nr:hypothetical protein [Streptomyces sp. AM 3-1-1]WEH28928.1 hypothetical protein P0D76_17270 [Streptomyces sp. AM 3-1-1]